MYLDEMRQKTINKNGVLSGVGLFTGENVSLEFCPAPENFGICFERVDLASKPKIFATIDSVKETPRCTLIGNESATIQTVEHLLSALSAYGVDNILIKLNGPEVPVADGSAFAFVELIEKCGLTEQTAVKKIYQLKKPVYWSNEDVHIIALPSKEYHISYTLHYPTSKLLRAQYYSVCVTSSKYKNDIASSRTFSIYEEIEPLLQKRLIKGGGLNNAVIIKEEKVMNPEGVRFPEEMARHKILDLIGDLCLMGISFHGHIIAIRSGHFSNVAFAKSLLNAIKGESSV